VGFVEHDSMCEALRVTFAGARSGDQFLTPVLCDLTVSPACGDLDESETISGGDFDDDGDINLADFSGFEACMADSNVLPNLALSQCVEVCLDAFDIDDDMDIDCVDLAEFQITFDAPLP
jgi:hypothetical protein